MMWLFTHIMTSIDRSNFAALSKNICAFANSNSFDAQRPNVLVLISLNGKEQREHYLKYLFSCPT